MKNSKVHLPSPQISQHPLMGVSFKNLQRILSAYGPVPLRRWPFIAAFVASSLLRAPFSMIDRWKTTKRGAVKKVKAPIFIVGYWRSGTTHLHNLLAQSPDVGIITPLASGLPNELLTLATWLEPLLEKGLPEDRGVDEVAVTLRSPQEDEIPVANLQALSIFHALYFPANFRENFNRGVFFDGASKGEIEQWKSNMLFFLRKVAMHQHKQPLLIKNPVYTGRINMLLGIWPEARFIHIYRNPYRVFRSNINYYPNIIDELGLQPYDLSEIEPVVLESYPRILNKLYHDVSSLAGNQFVEIQYEKLDREPINTLQWVYQKLNLPGWETAKTRTNAYLKSIADYSKNSYTYEKRDFEKVEKYWGDFVKRWDYQRPVS